MAKGYTNVRRNRRFFFSPQNDAKRDRVGGAMDFDAGVGKLDVVWPEYRIGLIPLVSQALHLFAAPAEVASRAATGVAKRGADVADQAADAPIPESAHTSGV